METRFWRTANNAVLIPLLCTIILTGSIMSASAKQHKHHRDSQSNTSSQPDTAKARHHHHSPDNQEASVPRHSRKRHADEQAASADTKRSKKHHHEIASADTSESRSGRHKPLTLHEKRLAKIHAEHLAQIAQAQNKHEEKLTRRQKRIAYQQHLHRLYLAEAQQHEEHMHRIRLAEIAREEAVRNKRHDKPSHIVNTASSSGLAIWQGDAYVAQVPIKIVQVNLNDPKIQVTALLASDGIGTSEPFTHMIDRAHPNVAVTGTFFSLDNLRPVGDIVVNGSLAYFGGMGTALAITPGNHASMITVPWGHHHNWSGYETVVACGPRLLSNGAIVLDPHMEHFKDQHMLEPNSRIGVGITRTNQLVFCMTREPIYLGRLAKIMRSLGCAEAMNLDAGTSTGFYCNGRMIAKPGRRLTNAIVVFDNHRRQRDDNLEAKAQVMPNTLSALSVTASIPLAVIK